MCSRCVLDLFVTKISHHGHVISRMQPLTTFLPLSTPHVQISILFVKRPELRPWADLRAIKFWLRSRYRTCWVAAVIVIDLIFVFMTTATLLVPLVAVQLLIALPHSLCPSPLINAAVLVLFGPFDKLRNPHVVSRIYTLFESDFVRIAPSFYISDAHLN